MADAAYPSRVTLPERSRRRRQPGERNAWLVASFRQTPAAGKPDDFVVRGLHVVSKKRDVCNHAYDGYCEQLKLDLLSPGTICKERM